MQEACTTLVSIANCLGRLACGRVADSLVARGTPRPALMVAADLAGCLSMLFLYASGESVGAALAGAACAGFAYGMIWTLIPTLASDLTRQRLISGFSPPWFVTQMVLGMLDKSVRSVAGFSVYELSPVSTAAIMHVPALFLHAEDDNLIGKHHVERLVRAYAGPRTLAVVEGSLHVGELRGGAVALRLDGGAVARVLRRDLGLEVAQALREELGHGGSLVAAAVFSGLSCLSFALQLSAHLKKSKMIEPPDFVRLIRHFFLAGDVRSRATTDNSHVIHKRKERKTSACCSTV